MGSDADKNTDFIGDLSVSKEDVQSALTVILSSEVFSNSPRLQQFLRYIVDETLAGRSAYIKGKTIAVDVYQRELGSGGAQNLVRVEARRLRRQLAEYYEMEGSADSIRIEIPPGAYRPTFREAEPQPTDTLKTAAHQQKRRKMFGGIFVAVIAMTFLIIGTLDMLQTDRPSPKTAGQSEQAVRKALREQSATTLQASNLAEQARGMFFPLFDVKRQKLALDIFRHTIELEPRLSPGYSGVAQILATLSIISPETEQAGKYLTDAREAADHALELDPSSAWALGASGWTYAVAGNDQEALKHARLALELAPEDGHVLDLVGLIAIVANKPELVALVSDPDRPRSGMGRFGARNIWGTSQYMLGNYHATIEAFNAAPAEGDPISAPSLMFLAVAHDHLGNYGEARRYIDELTATWPDFPMVFVVRQFFHEGSVYEQDILKRFAKYGYPASVND